MRNPGGANEGLDGHGEVTDAYGDLLVGQRVRVVYGGRVYGGGTVWCYPKNFYLSSIMPLIPVRLDGEQDQRAYARKMLEPLE